MKKCSQFLLPLLSGLTITVFGQGDSLAEYNSLKNRAQSLLDRLNHHEALVTKLLTHRDDTRLSAPPSRSFRPVPSPPPPEVVSPKLKPIREDLLPAPHSDDSDILQSKQDPDEKPLLNWPTKINTEGSLRHDGYYFGVVGARVWPLDGGVRWSGGGASMQFDDGYLAGILLGRDFGHIRAEVEHDSIHYNQKGTSGSAEIHALTFRGILEKELGRRVDLRTGIGAGIDRARLDYGVKDFEGLTFCYDFLAGLGVRLNDVIALNFDYRYFLTAASDDYERLQSHLLQAHLQFDL